MDKNLNFTSEDKEDLIKFLNLIAKHARFDLNTVELINYFKCLNKMQTNILPKVEANILEVIQVVEAKDSEKED